VVVVVVVVVLVLVMVVVVMMMTILVPRRCRGLQILCRACRILLFAMKHEPFKCTQEQQ
jgi:hypothetical protein